MASVAVAERMGKTLNKALYFPVFFVLSLELNEKGTPLPFSGRKAFQRRLGLAEAKGQRVRKTVVQMMNEHWWSLPAGQP